MNITQTVPNFLGGISQQGDFEKPPGYVQEAKNVYPDYTYGLQKRAGSRFQFDLGSATDLEGGRWFSLTVEGEQPFFAVILPATDDRDASIRVWNSVTGVEQTVTGDFTYLETNDRDQLGITWEDLKVNVGNRVAVIVNRKCEVDIDDTDIPGTLTGSVTIASELPADAAEGDIYRITNGTGAEDTIFVIFEDGAWVETARPGMNQGFTNSSAPHALVRTDTGFAFQEIDYSNRQVGNATTNPQPTFVGSFVENVFFYLNRVGFLSQNNVILSQPLDPTEDNSLPDVNFYRVSTLTQSLADPVDINATSVRPIVLRSVQPGYQGLILFADGEQFVLYSDSGVVNPQTAMIKSISTFELYGAVDAVEMGDEFFFISRTLRHSRMFRMTPQGIEQTPILTDVSKIINDYLPNDINNLVANSQNGFIALASFNEDKMYFYKTYKENNEIVFRSWYCWELRGKVQSCVFVRDKMYTVTSQGGRMAVSSINLSYVGEEDILTNLDNPGGFFNFTDSVGPFLDLWIGEERFTTTAEETWTDSEGTTWVKNLTLTMPSGYPLSLGSFNETTNTWSGNEPIAIQTTDELSRSNPELYLNLNQNAGTIYPIYVDEDDNWVIQGIWKQSEVGNFVVGYRYDYVVDLPTYYYLTEAGYDFNAYLNIDRFKFMFREAGEVQFQLKSIGRLDSRWKDVNPVTSANYYEANSAPLTTAKEFMIPIHQRNTNFKMRIFSDSPFPVTLSKLMWEGNYNPRYYRRA